MTPSSRGGVLVVLAGVALALLVLVETRGCARERYDSPVRTATATATSSATLTASQSVRVTVRLPSRRSRGPAPIEGAPPDDDTPEVTVEVSQALAATSSATAQASTTPVQDVGRLGLAVTTMPGVAALDYRVADLEAGGLIVGVDALAGLEAGGVALSAGRQLYGLAGAWSRWDARDRGLMVGLGVRL